MIFALKILILGAGLLAAAVFVAVALYDCSGSESEQHNSPNPN